MQMGDLDNNSTWTDGLPVCKLSGIGNALNQIYRKDGTSYSEHSCEDIAIRFCLDSNKHTYLYGIFDGHNGATAANFTSQRVPAELTFDQLTGKESETEVLEVFRNAFTTVESVFLESLDPKIAERTQLLEKIPDGMPQHEAAEKYPDIFKSLQNLEGQLSSGTTAVVALVHGGILYIGNVGDSRALLCKKDRSGVMRVRQLTAEHTTNSDDELQRLAALNLTDSKLRGGKLGSYKLTRCIGNYFLKGGYKELDILSSSTSEPVIPEPYVTSIPIDDSFRFLLLMSDGLIQAYSQATNSQFLNRELAEMVMEQFLEQPTLTSIAQTVVDKVVRLHHDMYLTKRSSNTRREDITLIIRNFNCPLPALVDPLSFVFVPDKIPNIHNDIHHCGYTNDYNSKEENPQQVSCFENGDALKSFDEENRSSLHTHTSSESSELINPSLTQLTLDDEGRIKAYVSFDEYLRNVDEAGSKGDITDIDLLMFK